MKYIYQATIIFGFTLLGELLHSLLPLPVPASIYGMVIMFVCLMTGVIKLEQVKETGIFLIEVMPVMFIPAGVGLMTSWGILKPVLLPVCIVTVVAIITVMVVTGRISQSIITRADKKNAGEVE